jgi:cytochrome c oxidase cbb3-type subunit 3
MKLHFFKKLFLSLLAWLPGMLLFAQTATPKSKGGLVDINWVLLAVALLLTAPIFILSKTLIYILKEKFKKENESEKENKKGKDSGKVAMLLLLMFSVLGGFAQDVAVKTKGKDSSVFDLFSGTTWMLMITILLELVVILFLSMKTVSFIRAAKPETIPLEEETRVKPKKTVNWLQKKWEKINNFRSEAEEADIDTGHDYDGIRELNNPAPIWFKAAFALSILFALGYLYRYHIAKSAPLQIEEFNLAMKEGEKQHQEYLKKQGDVIDENTVKMLNAEDIASGKLIFKTKCAPCHLETGAGSTGPNLTDNYWLHGGSIGALFKTVKYGWVEKGMQSWQSELSPKQIAQVVSFIKSIHGTNPPNAKAPQGVLENEEPVTPAVSVNKGADTIKTKLAGNAAQKTK